MIEFSDLQWSLTTRFGQKWERKRGRGGRGGEGREGKGRERWEEEEEGGKEDDYNTPIPIFLAWQPDVALVSTRFRPQCRHDWASDRSAADSYPHV